MGIVDAPVHISEAMALPAAMQDDPSLLDAVHLLLCEWTADELRGAESSSEEGVANLDDAADTVCLEGGRIASENLYAWLRGKMPPHLRADFLAEAQRLEWPYKPNGLPEREIQPPLLLRALRWHDEWRHLQDVLEEQLKHLHREGPSRKSVNDGVAIMSRTVHEIGDKPYNEGLAMAASALHMSVKVLILEWEFRCRWKQSQQWLTRLVPQVLGPAPATAKPALGWGSQRERRR